MPGIQVRSIVGRSWWTQQIRDEIARVAGHRSTVLITGPTGTGKELIARAIHATSDRAEAPFIPADCATFSSNLIASQLFGHRKGAFTGAMYEALGCFRAADRGTIFLDEIGELEPELQAKLLRVIQERAVIPLGGHEAVPVDVRVIAATNRDLKREVVAGRFRSDLYFRLNVVTLETLALSRRTEDIEDLAKYFLARLAEEGGLPRKTLSPGALVQLESYDWPGNVRQLMHLLEQAVIAAAGPIIPESLVRQLLERGKFPSPSAPSPAAAQRTSAEDRGESRDQRPPPDSDTDPWATLAEMERDYIRSTLDRTGQNQSAAARLLGISRHALIRKMKKYNLTSPYSVPPATSQKRKRPK